jgi:hypothetical protein
MVSPLMPFQRLVPCRQVAVTLLVTFPVPRRHLERYPQESMFRCGGLIVAAVSSTTRRPSPMEVPPYGKSTG